MEKVILNLEVPISDKKPDIFHVYLGGKGLHDLSFEEEYNVVLTLLSTIRQSERPLIVGRLDADGNDEFINALKDRNVPLQIVEATVRRLSFTKRLFAPVLQDYSQPWVFFEEWDLSRLMGYFADFWTCYGGFWVFISPKEGFDIRPWQNAKAQMRYDIWELARNQAAGKNSVLIVSDDYALDIFAPMARLECLLEEVFKLARKFRMQVLTK